MAKTMNSVLMRNDGGRSFPASGKPYGKVMLLHGLNQDPGSWQDMTVMLNTMGLHVFRLALTGHRKHGFSEMRRVTAARWLEDFHEGYQKLVHLAPDLPTYLVGFSLGCLLPLTAQLMVGRSLFSRQVLLAPAVRVHLYTRLVLIVSHFVRSLPSRSSARYVANREGTSAEAYKALFDIEKRFRRSPDLHLINIPTTVLMRRADELVDYRGIQRLITSKALDNWRLVPLKDHAPLPEKVTRFQHMIVDRESCGEEGWQLLGEEISTMFDQRN